MGTLHGSWIWYDLLTPDPEGAKAFYAAVVGWSMTTGHGAAGSDYGFITAPDGAMVGGILRLTPDRTRNFPPRFLGMVLRDWVAMKLGR